MEWVETTGRTVEEAKELALDRLGVHEDDAEFEVLEEPRPGLFGRLRGEARVRARVRPSQPRPKAERRERRRPSEPRPKEAAAVPASASATDGAATPAAGAEDAAPEPAVAGPSGANVGPQPRPSPGDDGQAREAVAPEQVVETSRTFLTGVLDAFGLSGTVDAVVTEEIIEMQIDGDDLGLLIGPRGRTMGSLQELMRLAVQHRVGAGGPRLHLDVAGYRQRRREALQRFVEQVAREVVATGTPKALEPMSAADRKVIHDTAGSIPGVTTLSEGEEPNRRVVVTPSA